MLSQQEPEVSREETRKIMLEKAKKLLRIRNSTIRKMLAEALGTFILMVRRSLCTCMCRCLQPFKAVICKVSGFLPHPQGCPVVGWYCSLFCFGGVAVSQQADHLPKTFWSKESHAGKGRWVMGESEVGGKELKNHRII